MNKRIILILLACAIYVTFFPSYTDEPNNADIGNKPPIMGDDLKSPRFGYYCEGCIDTDSELIIVDLLTGENFVNPRGKSSVEQIKQYPDCAYIVDDNKQHPDYTYTDKENYNQLVRQKEPPLSMCYKEGFSMGLNVPFNTQLNSYNPDYTPPEPGIQLTRQDDTAKGFWGKYCYSLIDPAPEPTPPKTEESLYKNNPVTWILQKLVGGRDKK